MVLKAINRERIIQVARPAVQVLAGQLSFQAMGLVISFLLIRNLTKPDFAIYTLLLSIQSMITVLSGSGIMVGFRKLASPIWGDDKSLSSLIRSARGIRGKLFLVALLIANGYGFFILINQGFSYPSVILYLIFISLTVAPDINSYFFEAVLLLKKRISVVQWAAFIKQVIRFGLVALGVFCFKKLVNINTVLFITFMSAWISYFFLAKKSKPFTQKNIPESTEYKKTLLHYIKINWHNAAFFTFKGQISIFLIGLFGSTEGIADLGALTRFPIVFLLLTALVTNLFLPAFGREQDKGKLRKLYLGAILGCIALTAIILPLVVLFANPMLKLLGNGYMSLKYELFLVFLSALVTFTVGAIQGMNTYKGWIKYNTYFSIPVDIASIFLGLYIFNVTQLSGVLYLSIMTSCLGLILVICNSIHGFSNL